MALWQVETRDGVAVARYDNPPMNYFCAEAARELGDLISSWRDPALRAVVLTGARPGTFITHYSVEELCALAGNEAALEALGPDLSAGYQALVGRLRELPKPVIAALNGDTMGGGFELSLACDIRIAARGDHRIGLPEVTLGILPGGSGTQRLARLIGAGRALDFILRGRVCAPEEALALGLVHELADDAAARAEELARGLAAHSPLALAEIKRAVHQGSDLPLAAGLALESDAFFHVMRSEDARRLMAEYVATPLEKRREWLERHRALRHPRD